MGKVFKAAGLGSSTPQSCKLRFSIDLKEKEVTLCAHYKQFLHCRVF